MASESADLNPVQKRCLAVLNGNAPASDELKRAAERLLASGGELTKGRVAKAVVARGPAKQEWSCRTCTLKNDAERTSCTACGTSRQESKKALPAEAWTCSRCTLENGGKLPRCSACKACHASTILVLAWFGLVHLHRPSVSTV